MITVIVGIASSWSLYSFAATVKESNLREQLVKEQTVLAEKLDELHHEEGVILTKEKLETLTQALETLEKQARSLSEKNQAILQPQIKALVEEV